MLRLTASLAGDIPVRLGEAVTASTSATLVKAVLHASGQRQFSRLPLPWSRARARQGPNSGSC